MSDEGTSPSEALEIRRVFRLTGRGYLLAGMSGIVWHAPVSSLMLEIVITLISGFLLYFSVLPLAIASMGWRNILGRNIGLEGRRTTVLVLGVAILAALLALGAIIFGLARHVYPIG